MVKFGRHNKTVRENLAKLDDGSYYYVIDYNKLKQLAIDADTNADSFQLLWTQELNNHQKWLTESSIDLYRQVYQAIAHDPQACGLPQRAALNMFVAAQATHQETKQSTSKSTTFSASDLLRRMKRIELASTNNQQALRKSVKKFDKNKPTADTSVSSLLLPVMYSHSFATFTTSINILTRTLSQQQGSSIPRWWKLLDYVHETTTTNKHSTTSNAPNAPKAPNAPNAAKTLDDMQDEIDQNRRAELAWLHQLSTTMSDRVRKRLVLHRGFHSYDDSSSRPIENSLTAYETAWSAGMKYCECDISLTLDEHIILCHDANFKRLALFGSGTDGTDNVDPSRNASNRLVSELTLRELIALPLKSGQRPPLLTDVLQSASRIGSGSQLVIEIKPGNAGAAKALCALFSNEPHLLEAVGVIMSFDLWVIHQFAKEFQELEDKWKAAGGAGGAVYVRQFKMLLLTVCEAEDKPPYLRLNLMQEGMDEMLNSWLRTEDSLLDVRGLIQCWFFLEVSLI